jgi:hypothetical protein
MLVNLLLGLITMVFCLALQMVPLVMVLSAYQKRVESVLSAGAAARLLFLARLMLVLVIGNIVQVMIWAGLFVWLDEFGEFSEAVYHSAVNFATLGYGDIVMSEAHRLLGPIQAINGVLMIGVSTATLMAALQDMLRRSNTTE